MASDNEVRIVGKPGSEFKAFDQLREELAEKGIEYERIPKISSIDNPPACFLYRAKGNMEEARENFVAWLRLKAETADITYRFDVPGEINYCRDCTPMFKAEACGVSACGFPNVVFETLRYTEDDEQVEEVVGVSRGVLKPGQYWYEGIAVDEAALPQFIKDLLAAVREEKGNA